MKSKWYLLLTIGLLLLLVSLTVGCEQLGLIDSKDSQPITPRTLQMTKEWNGTGIKTTDIFVIELNPWAVSWANNPEVIDDVSIGMLEIMVYDADNPDAPVALVAFTRAAQSDISYVYRTGTFYLTIKGPNTGWQVQIWE